METVNIHDAKTHLSKLIERVVKGESIIIAKAGKPLVKLTAIEPAEPKPVNRVGFMKGQLTVPDDFDIKAFGRDEIDAMFFGDE
jgi:prevent-host-death family protein